MILNNNDRTRIQVLSTKFYIAITDSYGKSFAEWLFQEIYHHARDRYCIKKYGCTVDKNGDFQ